MYGIHDMGHVESSCVCGGGGVTHSMWWCLSLLAPHHYTPCFICVGVLHHSHLTPGTANPHAIWCIHTELKQI